MKVIEIFESIDGEVNGFHQGRLTTFIRFAGCNLDCPYCDTKDSRDPNNGKEMTVGDIVNTVMNIGNTNITITGGEPLLQKELYDLLEKLSDHKVSISIETNGSLFSDDLFDFDNVRWVVDVKLWGINNFLDNKLNDLFDIRWLDYLEENDFLKFVICNSHDYNISKHLISLLHGRIFKVAFSPDLNQIDVRELLYWIQQDNLYGVIINVQLHKLLGLR